MRLRQEVSPDQPACSNVLKINWTKVIVRVQVSIDWGTSDEHQRLFWNEETIRFEAQTGFVDSSVEEFVLTNYGDKNYSYETVDVDYEMEF